MIAAREAAARLWPAGTTVHVISVVEPIYGWSAPDLEEALQQSAEQTVQCAAEYFREAGLETTTAVLTGDPKSVIVNEAADSRADFIVLGAHSTHGVMQFLLGGVARAVARLATCSVEIVRRSPGPEPLKILLASRWLGMLQSGCAICRRASLGGGNRLSNSERRGAFGALVSPALFQSRNNGGVTRQRHAACAGGYVIRGEHPGWGRHRS